MNARTDIVSLGLLMALGCGGGESAPEEAPPGSPSGGGEASGHGADVRDHMATNFRLAMDARDAIIQGNLVGAKEAAKSLAFHDHSQVLPARWMDDVKKMQDAAGSIAMATDLSTAATAVAELAATCGDCHARLKYTGDEGDMEHGLSTSKDEDMQERMLRHQRAADGLWFGLTIPSDTAWRGGARALTEAPLSAPTEDGQPVSPEVNDKMEETLALGRVALDAQSREQRTQAYGTLLISCTNCHASE